jgi:glutaminyl-tRNA synthetase
VLTNWPAERVETLTMENYPDRPDMGSRQVPFGRELYIEGEDFMLNPPGKFFRLRPGGEVRLKGAYIIRCDEVILDDSDSPVELRCTVDLSSRSGGEGAARKVKGTLHWVHAPSAVPIEARLYEPLLNDEEDLDAGDAEGEESEAAAPEKKDFIARLNPDSLETVRGYGEPALGKAAPGDRFQFLRVGYFAADRDSRPESPVFNRTVGLKDSWGRAQGKSV